MPLNERKLVLLGPQPEFASLQTVLADLQPQLPVALITAGWETEESDDGDLKAAIDIEAINLNLFERTERLFSDDPELIKTLRTRQDELRHLRDAYNDRLNHLLKAARQIIRRHDPLIDLGLETESAIEMVRQLDREYFVRTSQLIDRYEQQLQIAYRPHVIQHRREIGDILNRVHAVLIAGGHVAIILNRLRIFGILDMRTELPIVAWSGGTMALSDQVVFFHDSPPQGPGDAEVLRAGMSLYHDVLPLPDGKTRLNLDDQARVELFARRFNRFKCVIFDEQTILERENGNWIDKSPQPAMRLGDSGHVVELNA